ncbi:nuclear transport factor 2 family protein [Flavobacterium sp.]|uniref:nuclear transport factor 2 family protein n=1 Tax=Flavobacterium sp. TaxID=239 RepID=UPI00121C50DC|nr:nuclear transport factor 2 family protein [Flavobacterium sp.]RZJ69097.1 MAG: nuclear transport factor 2 family protein [Flavobacterium sp.]
MRHLFLLPIFLVLGNLYSQNDAIALETELPITKLRHHFRGCDAAFLADSEATDENKKLSDKEVLWQNEQLFWKSAKANDIKPFLRLLDEDFQGHFSNIAFADKAHVANWVDKLKPDAFGNFDYKLSRRSETVSGNVAVVFYEVDLFRIKSSGKITKTTSLKVNHTWALKNDDWLLISAMQ